MSYAMKTRRGSRGFSLVETMVAVGIFGMVTFAIFEGLVGIERTMEFESSKDRAEGGTTRFFAQLGQGRQGILLRLYPCRRLVCHPGSIGIPHPGGA